ncbi:MAG: PTS-dependent dihydroxyacetone kinase phosphotransferase subunit DhaM [Firmicutes bacterium]|nr:PTS-dependent dihydroxyacetone kinase phosphotransferase subunit DhaM [Candidatus Colivicinus equi]
MVGIVIVSHSKLLAEGVIDLVRMTSKKVKIAAAGGLENGEYGTSYDLINKAIDEVYSEDGAIIFVDLGSSIMTSEMVIEDRNNPKIVLSKADLVNGAFAASIYAENNATLEEIISKVE